MVALVAIATSANALRGGFVWDDIANVVLNPWITGPAHLPAVFTTHVAGFDRALATSFYRPGMHLLLMAVRAWFGMEPWAFHLVGVLLHAACSVLVVLIARRWLHDGAVLAGLAFAAHPVHVESVAWISGITDVSSACFGLLAIALALRGRDLAGAVALFAGLLCKELAISVPVLIVASGVTRVKRFIPYAVATLAYLLLRWNALGDAAPARRDWNLDALGLAANAFALFARDLGLLVLPIGLNPAHPFHPVPSPVEPIVLAGLASAALLLALAYTLRRERAVVFGAACLVIPLLPAVYLPALGENPIAERYLYLPSAGFVLLLAVGWESAVRRAPHARAVWTAAATIAVASCLVATVRRNEVWRDALTLWSDAAARAPDSVVAQQNLGDALREAGRFEEAIARYKSALALEPTRADALNNLGVAYQSSGRGDLAAESYRAALTASPRHASAHANLGLVLIDAGRFDEGVAECEAALRIDPDQTDAHHNLGIAYARQGRMDLAIPELEAAVRLRPDVPIYRQNLERARSSR